MDLTRSVIGSVTPRVRRRPIRLLVAVLVAVVTIALAGCGSSATSPPAAGAPSSGSLPTSATTGAPVAGEPSLPGASPTVGGSIAGAANGFTRLPDPIGRLLVTTLTGPVSGVRMRVWVWLPPQYDDPRNARTDFPALMLFPGGSGAGYNTWAGHQYGAQELVAGAAAGTPTAATTASGPIAPFVFVMPQMQLSDRLDTECADLPGQPRVGTFLAEDVRALVLRSFRISPDRRSWATAGASSGGYCAARLAFNHPEQYSAVVSIDGYFHVETGLPGAKDASAVATDPDHLAVTRPPDLAVLLWVGAAARVDTRESVEFLALLRPPTTGVIRALPGGRHLTKDFARMMPDVLQWLTAHLSGPVRH